MKIKLGFVTNSSSTSFCAWGLIRDTESGLFLPEKLVKKSYSYYLKIKSKSECQPLMKCFGEKEDIVSFDIFCKEINDLNYTYTDYVEGYLRSLDIDSIFVNEHKSVYIGRSPFDMDDDETLKNFKDILKLDLMQLGFEDPQLYPIAEELDY